MASDGAAAEAGNAGGMKRAKSMLTTMLDNPENRHCHDVFAAVPQKHGEETESTPHTTLPVPKGMDYYFTFGATLLVGLVIAYICTIGFGVVFALIDMMGGSCGQDVWGTDADTACRARVKNAVALSIELRCHEPKPLGMAQEDFDGVCGSDALMQTLINVAIVFGIVSNSIYKTLQEMPANVVFHENLFTIEAANGKEFTCSYYADVTKASFSWDGLVLKSKAAIKVRAGGADEEEEEDMSNCFGCGSGKKVKVLSVLGDGSIKLFHGDGDKKKEFLTAFAQHLPVSIEGLDGAPTPNTSYTVSMLDGRLGELLKARKAKDASEYDAARKPFTCDLFAEVILVFFCIVIGWYVISIISTFIGWAVNKAKGKCLDPMKPGEDMCAVWRIFVPIQTPLASSSDYFNVCMLCGMLIIVPLWYFTEMKVEYRFHKAGVLQEVAMRGAEDQDNVMIFPNDIKALETVSSFEKYIKATTQVQYITKGGIDKPFKITAKFIESTFKFTLIDTQCASCSGGSAKAGAFNQKLTELITRFKPGLLDSTDTAAQAGLAESAGM